MSKVGVHFSSASNEWATPMELFKRIEAKHGPFTLDPCCTKKTAKAKKYFTKADDGLDRWWDKERVFMNPPYGREIGKWIKKAWEQWHYHGSMVVCLIPSRTDTIWWHNYCMKASRIVFFKGRIKFEKGNKKAPAPFPSCLVIFDEKSVDEPPIFDTMLNYE